MTSMTTTDQSRITAAINAMSVAIGNIYADNMVQYEMAAALPGLTTYSTTTLERIIRYPWNHLSAGRAASKMGLNEWDETTVNDYMEVSTALGRTSAYGIPFGHVESWHLYSDLHPFNNDGEYPDERLSQLTALLLVTESLQSADKNTSAKSLNDDKLRAFVLYPESPYRREDIVDIITTHHEHDVGRIKAMLDHGSPALRSGVL